MLHIYWPALTCLTMFITLVILLMLRFGSRWGLRHTALPDYEWRQRQHYVTGREPGRQSQVVLEMQSDIN